MNFMSGGELAGVALHPADAMTAGLQKIFLALPSSCRFLAPFGLSASRSF